MLRSNIFKQSCVEIRACTRCSQVMLGGVNVMGYNIEWSGVTLRVIMDHDQASYIYIGTSLNSGGF